MPRNTVGKLYRSGNGLEMSAQPSPEDDAALWRALLGLPSGHVVRRHVEYGPWISALSPALIADIAPQLALPLELIREARLFGRYQETRQLQALGWIADAGFDCIAIKGFAAAFLYYPTPASRLIGDLDLLVRNSAIPDLVAALGKLGFRFGSVERNPWGFLSDASFMPFHSPDGKCNIDLHVQPDSYPLHLGLDVEEVFSNARDIVAADRAVKVPNAVHMAAIFVSNFAKDKFAPDGLRKLLDLARLLRHEHDFSWPSLRDTLKLARLSKALDTTACLLRGFGTPDELLPDDLGRCSGALMERLLSDWRQQNPPTLMQRLQREWRLAAEPGVAATLMWRRAKGLMGGSGGAPVSP